MQTAWLTRPWEDGAAGQKSHPIRGRAFDFSSPYGLLTSGELALSPTATTGRSGGISNFHFDASMPRCLALIREISCNHKNKAPGAADW